MSDLTLEGGESITSYVSRLAADEPEDSARRYLSDLCGYDIGPLRLFPQTIADADAAAVAIGLSTTTLHERALLPIDGVHRSFFGVAIPALHLEREHRRFAPATLAVSPYCRATWQLRLYPFCEESWQFLTNACGRCHALQQWTRSYAVDACDVCLDPLSNAQADTVPEPLQGNLAMALGLIHPDPTRRLSSAMALPAPLRSHPAEVYRLMSRLLPVIEPTLEEKPQRLAGGDPLALASAMSEAWDVVSNWPEGAIKLFDGRLANATSQHSDGNGGRSVRLLNPTIGERLDPTVAGWLGELRDLVSVDDDRLLDDGLVPVMDVRQRLGLVGRDLAHLRERDFLRCVMRTRSRRAATFYVEDEVRSLELQIRDRMTPGGVGERLGIATYGAHDLITSGLIPPYDHPFLKARYGETLTGFGPLSDFTGRLHDAATKADLLGHTIPLSKLIQAIGGRRKPWCAIARLLLDRAVTFGIKDGRQRLFARIHIETSDSTLVARLVGEALADTSPASISARDLGELMNLPSVAYTAVARLAAIGRSNKKKEITLDTALELASRYVSVLEVAARLGRSPRSARSILEDAGLRSDHPAGYARHEVEPLIGSLRSS